MDTKKNEYDMSKKTETSQTWVQLPLNEKLTILSNIAEKKGIIENAVEKDFWVSIVLKCIFSLPCSKGIVFKGGTSLSKGWDLIERFSEDCDLAIDRDILGFSGELKKKEITKLRKESKKFVDNTLVPQLQKALNEMGLSGHFKLENPKIPESDKDPVEFFIEYNSILSDKNEYLKERVKVEISCRSLTTPFQMVGMRSMIADFYPNESFAEPVFNIPTVSPEKTFLEKIFLLHEEFNRTNGGGKIDRLTRHFYDIEKMMDKEFVTEVLKNESLYSDLVEHRSKFTAWSGFDYQTHHPTTISFLPPDALKKTLEADYEEMKKGFIYGEKLTYEELIERISVLQERLRELKCNTSFFKKRLINYISDHVETQLNFVFYELSPDVLERIVSFMKKIKKDRDFKICNVIIHPDKYGGGITITLKCNNSYTGIYLSV